MPNHAADKLSDITQRMTAALQLAGRDAAAAQLLAISKTKPVAAITPLIEAGHRHFGENRVQEAAEKWPALKVAHEGLELHLVGPLQTNKAKEAVALFDVIQTLDREKLARKMAALKDAQAEEATGDILFPRFFIQVNSGDEPQKSGVSPSELGAFHGLCTAELGLNVVGLMCLPPQDEAAGPHFALLAKLAAGLGLSQLSMGMSGDFETALSLGATHIRVGTALFGTRD
jgi:pyridoxal phosphate enzyme (YggS family)